MNTLLRRRAAPALSIIALALLASCGGGGDEASPTADTGRETAQAVFTPSGTIPADANLRGLWSGVNAWPLIPLHAVLMPDGRVMSYGTDATGRQTANFIYDVWDPAGGLSGGHLTLPNGTATDIFCSSQLVLPQGDAVFIAGGDNWTGSATTNTGNNNSNTFTLASNTLARGNNMNRPRWYSTSTTLTSGEIYIQGGSGGTDRPEVRQADGSFRLLANANTSGFDFMYPRNFVAPDGRVFGYDSAGRMYYVDPSGNGTVAGMGQFNSAYTGSDASAAMFRPGRILQFGGNSNGAIVIDIRNGAPVVTPTASMSTQRRLVTGTLLADGKVLATGGSKTWNALDTVNNSAEIWNPDTGTWTVGASGVQARLYHSMALLLPDATVMVGGGGAPGPQNNLNFELYYPPYLFAAGGTLAPRLSIDSAPTVLDIGRTFGIDVSGGSAARVVMVKSGSVTHSWNMEQRFVELTFNASGGHLNVQAPTRAADAPPGFYMLFVLDAAGVPSVAKIVRVNIASTPNPAITPTLASPGDQTAAAGSPATLTLAGTDPNGDPLSYSATGLPPGLSLDAASGVVSGTPNTVGAYNVVATASDGVNAASVNFTWTVTGAGGAFSVSIAEAPTASVTGSTASFTASANGVNTRYQWDFGDGTAATAFSTSPSASHTYTRAGLFYVTVIAVDDSGIEQRATVLQPIHLPLTAGRPGVSSNLVVETPAGGGNTRLWVVNQDNDTVSVFDTVTRGKLAEISVGAAPRSLAVAANGSVWVANKQGASLSVIDPATLTVSRTITLPRGSQPFGVATSASGFALAVLEGSGQLLKFDTASYAQTGSRALGTNPRHVSISADGATAYVSRFITPPLPGESTAAVAPTAATGGEVLTIDTATLNLVRSVVLAHSDKADAENQGRGVPNYLGAAVISPDGASAWVPGKQDNLKRGALRDTLPLNFQNTVRAISSRIDLAGGSEELAARIDHDNASMASAAVFDPKGLFLFIALETSREVAVVDAHGRREMFRFEVGRAPQGLALSVDGLTLYVNNFMDRSVSVFDLRPLMQQGQLSAPPLATLNTVATEKLAATVLRGKQFFYDARDTRLARDRYMSCASCHNDGGHDGRTWDLTGFGEGLRNTISLRGRAGAMGFLHWSNNFDEVQDFEGQIRNLAGGTGLMADADFNAGTRSQPLGDRKTGVSADLDALAAYLASLNSFDAAPARPGAAALSTTAAEGKALFTSLNCASCHSGAAFSGSGENTLANVGTLKTGSGKRLGATLTGIDVPTLRDVWATAPYLHDGSAPTLEAAVRAHSGVNIVDADLARLTAYLREIGGDEGPAPAAAGSGTGLAASYFNNLTLTAPAALARTEAVDFDWGTGAPTGVNADNFSVRWSGTLTAPATGTYRFQTESDDGVRLWVNDVQLVNNWTDHSASVDTSAGMNLAAGQKVDITLEYYEKGGGALMRLRWLTPGDSAFVAIPASRLAPPSAGTGLAGSYFNNVSLTGAAVLSRTEAVDFSWGTGSPGTGVNTNNFSTRWTGSVAATAAGSYRFQTVSDDGVRVWVNGIQVINNWTDHASATNTSAAVSFAAGQKLAIRVEYYEKGGNAVMRLRWLVPGTSTYVAIPRNSLYPQ